MPSGRSLTLATPAHAPTSAGAPILSADVLVVTLTVPAFRSSRLGPQPAETGILFYLSNHPSIHPSIHPPIYIYIHIYIIYIYILYIYIYYIYIHPTTNICVVKWHPPGIPRQVAAGTAGSCGDGSDGGLRIDRQESLAEVEPTWAPSLGVPLGKGCSAICTVSIDTWNYFEHIYKYYIYNIIYK